MAITFRFKRGDGVISDPNEIAINTNDYSLSANAVEYAPATARNISDPYDKNRIITVDANGRLVNHKGEPIRELGMNNGSWTASVVSYGVNIPLLMIPNSEQLLSWDEVYEDIARYASYGFRYVRLTLTNWNARWMHDTYDAIGAEEYWARLNKLFDLLHDHGIGVWLILSCGHTWMIDYYGQDGDGPSDWMNPAHPIMTGITGFVREAIQNLGHHEALAGYDLGGEYNIKPEWETILTPDADKDTLNFYRDNDPVTFDNVNALLAALAQVVKDTDPYGRAFRSGAGDSSGMHSSWTYHASSVIDFDRNAPVVGKNVYPSHKVGNQSYHDLRDELVMYRRLAKAQGKPFHVGESGSLLGSRIGWHELNGYGPENDGIYGWDLYNMLYSAIVESGVQLVFSWQWSRMNSADPYTIGFDIHPDNDLAGNWRWLNDLSNWQYKMQSEGYVDPDDISISQFSDRLSNSVKFRTGGTAGGAVSYDIASYTSGHETGKGFTVGFWVKIDSIVDTQFNTIIDTLDNTTKRGFRIYAGPDGTLNVLCTYDNNGTTGYIGHTSRTPNLLDGWNHVVVQAREDINGTGQGTIDVYLNGKGIVGTTFFDYTIWPGAVGVGTIVFGGQSWFGQGFNGELAQVRYFRAPLNDGEVYALYAYDHKPQFARRWEWDFVGTLDSNYTNANGWVYQPQTAIVHNTAPQLANNFVLPNNIVK